MDDKTHKLFLIFNILLLLVNILLVGWQIEAKRGLNKSYDALEKTFAVLRHQHAVINSTYVEKIDDIEFENSARFCSLNNGEMALEINPMNQQATYWPELDFNNPGSSQSQAYEYTISGGSLILQNESERVPFRVFKVIEINDNGSRDVITGLLGGAEINTDWCRS